ncbi:hypothetical protein [Hyphomicrobium sp.]|uniref:hypothetical protein n=1 Tax=Hyphomicrobium sp. TaxID=82 RepID=UPI001D774992|nr:hypothetical protein [Hyphomicrobium sp.]MBY0559929.1 hypothetical protein [Hyphomicrobium sp.]
MNQQLVDLFHPHAAGNYQTITPEMAAEWLNFNTVNRLFRPHHAAAIARAIQAGEWQDIGGPILFSNETPPVLLDGQHRLSACVIARMPIRAPVIWGLDRKKVMAVIDTGITRSNADHAHLAGHRNAAVFAATVRALYAIKSRNANITSYLKITALDQEAMSSRHPRLDDSITTCLSCGAVSRSMAAAVHYCAAELVGQRQRADEFAEVLRTGVPNYPGDAAHFAREWIAKKGTSERNGRARSFQMLVWGWNNFATKSPVARRKSVQETMEIDGLDVDKI